MNAMHETIEYHTTVQDEQLARYIAAVKAQREAIRLKRAQNYGSAAKAAHAEHQFAVGAL